ncbi:hypothetical protein [Neobacillus sp. FSL H8-0543]|uniref:hypothetical protein n=1 Tax=Neobacillus sp. FSL H8-0543 TaxID=2954672 RepID=UPI0031587E1D
MAKNYVDNKDIEVFGRTGENELTERDKKGRTGYNDGENPSRNDKEQQLPGDEIVEDLRELSRQQGKKDGNHSYLNGENVQQDTDLPRYGDSISGTVDKEFRKEEVESPSERQNGRVYQVNGPRRNSN